MYSKIIYLFLIVFVAVHSAKAQPAEKLYPTSDIAKIKNYILDNRNDSALYYLAHATQFGNTELLKRIAANNGAYSDVFEFVGTIDIGNRQDLNKLNRFLEQKAPTPPDRNIVNLSYVKIKWVQIQSMLNEELLKDAEKQSSLLNSYINSCADKHTDNYRRAKIYAGLYDVVSAIIQHDTSSLKAISLKNLAAATALNDTDLIVATKYYYSEYLVSMRHVSDYLANARACLMLEEHRHHKSMYYEPVVENYIDAATSKRDYDAGYIEALLLSIYNDPNTTYYSYSLFAKFLGVLPENSPWAKHIFHQFQVADLLSFCDKVCVEADGKINSNELFNLYNECATALLFHKLYAQAFTYKDRATRTIKTIYSKELAQSIADNQTLEVKRIKEIENEKLQQENGRKEMAVAQQRRVIWGISIALVVVIVLLLFLFSLTGQRNASNMQLSAANKDLEKLNTLNRKIFYVISHDFNAPMLTLSLLIKNLRRDSVPGLTRHLDEVEEQFNNANAVLLNLLNWSKAEMNFTENNMMQKADLKIITDEILNQLSGAAANKHLVFQCFGVNVATVNLPADILRIVLRNIISNAIKYSYSDSVIQLSFDVASMQLKITDNGVGIYQEQLKELFTKDVVSTFGTKMEPGFGIGLYIVAELLRKYNCSIDVISRPAEGTTFIITFPFAE